MTNPAIERDADFAELLLNSTGEGIYAVDLEGNCTFANRACVRLLGFESADELLGRNMHELVHHTLPNGREGEGVHVDDEIMWRADGSNFFAEYWSYPMHRDGESVGSALTFVDITERVRTEQALRESQERTELLLDSTGEGIYGVDLAGNCTFANRACVRLLGFESADELLGRNMHELVHHTLPNGFREGDGVHVDDEIMWRADGTSFPAEYWSYPMHREGRVLGSVLTFVDITARRRVESKLRVEHARAERLLLNVLAMPGRTVAERFDSVTALFADIVGFTPLSARMDPERTVEMLNEVFSAFDQMAADLGVEKIRTIGDGYMVVAGAPVERDDHCDAIARLALGMRSYMAERTAHDGHRLAVRMGISTGAAVGAVVGTSKFHWDVWGDAINIASRMESSGVPGKIQVARPAYEALKSRYELVPRGAIDVKGRGEMSTWFLEGATA
jgi:PAS domain S-box-containing protein